jgi:hypothetical protein
LRPSRQILKDKVTTSGAILQEIFQAEQWIQTRRIGLTFDLANILLSRSGTTVMLRQNFSAISI